LLDGPEEGIGAGLQRLGAGAWVTTGRTAVLEGPDHLLAIDPGDEPCGSPTRPTGPLKDLADLVAGTGKPLRWIALTHSHPDHVTNLETFRSWSPDARVIAHRSSPVPADVRVGDAVRLDVAGGLHAQPTPGHSAAGDDLTLWRKEGGLLFPGDLIQPKGERWEEAFYPSPWPYFVDGDVYVGSLRRLLDLPVETLVTGHREVRRGRAAQGWVALTLRAILAVEAAVAGWEGNEELEAAGEAIFRGLAAERGIPPAAVDGRLAGGSTSAFARFDLPGVAYYWQRRARGFRRGP
jgi:glyoxylase-like metal-dependent hydrolase (beta-lactamase superfamily II)